MRQQFGDPERAAETPGGKEAVQRLDELREAVPGIVRAEPGLQIGGIASSLGVPVDVAQVIVRPLVADEQLTTRGTRRGMRYFAPEDAPPQEKEQEDGAETLDRIFSSDSSF
jgi:hypothetical protein